MKKNVKVPVKSVVNYKVEIIKKETEINETLTKNLTGTDEDQDHRQEFWEMTYDPPVQEEFELECEDYDYNIQKTNNSDPSVRYYFNQIVIIGIFDGYVYLKGLYAENDESHKDNPHDCIIKISKWLFNKSWTSCLRDTEELCKDSMMFCEAWGSIASYDFEEIVEADLQPLGLKVYKIKHLDSFTNMRSVVNNTYIPNRILENHKLDEPFDQMVSYMAIPHSSTITQKISKEY